MQAGNRIAWILIAFFLTSTVLMAIAASAITGRSSPQVGTKIKLPAREPHAVAPPATVPSPAYAATHLSSTMNLWRNTADRTEYEICVNWRNTGTKPIGLVRADLRAYDPAGALLFEAKGVTVFEAKRRAELVAPGASYEEPYGQGFIASLEQGKRPMKVQVEIVQASGSPNTE